MTNKPRIVLDTNVVVSAALLPRSAPRQAVDKAVENGQILISLDVIAELDEVLRRPKLDRYLSEDDRIEFLSALINEAEVVEVHEVIHACRDEEDDKFLELAISGQADLIVTGDRDLLILHPFRGVDIITPQQFLARQV
jgi:putative PIN family toxin of toxin-antitoxin system